eukprot:CAMPEP_0184857226 /NCGR_PEP_ID=MMETSP0580-20130426/2394_1 /TAXON_ID=1118495 /ORGANISM="Dactyliosolen fragilissimus" /LENGTH=697 /DNA_ID=CAMNT_0027352703 /DNA_START=91 /DNA_END=2184 /DNA_ORIENTATION=-
MADQDVKRKQAVELIRTLDEAFAEMSSLSFAAKENAEEARRNARMAKEVARRYTNRSYAQNMNKTSPSKQIDPPPLPQDLPKWLPEVEEEASMDDYHNDHTHYGHDEQKLSSPSRVSQSSPSSQPFSPSPSTTSTFLSQPVNTPILHRTQPLSTSSQPATTNTNTNTTMNTNTTTQSHYPMTHKPTTTTKNNNNTTTTTTTATTPQKITMAESNAEDVLHLSLELENFKHRLQIEQTNHEHTTQALQEANGQKQQLATQLTQMTMDYDAKIQNLERELSIANERVLTAEEDAQVALDIAKESQETREQVESLLERALHEIELLRNENNGGDAADKSESLPQPHDDASWTPENTTSLENPLASIQEETDSHGASSDSNDNDTLTTDPDPVSSPSLAPSSSSLSVNKKMVAMGRDLLLRARASQQIPYNSTTTTTTAPSTPSSNPKDLSTPSKNTPTTYNTYLVDITRRSAQKRKKLRERLSEALDKENEENEEEQLLATSTSSSQPKSKQPPPPPPLPQSTSTTTTTTTTLSTTSSHPKKGNYPSSSSENGYAHASTIQNISIILRQSGIKLNLGGRWFHPTSSFQPSLSSHNPNHNHTNTSSSHKSDTDYLNLEALAKNYCKFVEVRIGRQKEEVKELEAFCQYLEQSLLTQKDNDPHDTTTTTMTTTTSKQSQPFTNETKNEYDGGHVSFQMEAVL